MADDDWCGNIRALHAELLNCVTEQQATFSEQRKDCRKSPLCRVFLREVLDYAASQRPLLRRLTDQRITSASVTALGRQFYSNASSSVVEMLQKGNLAIIEACGSPGQQMKATVLQAVGLYAGLLLSVAIYFFSSSDAMPVTRFLLPVCIAALAVNSVYALRKLVNIYELKQQVLEKEKALRNLETVKLPPIEEIKWQNDVTFYSEIDAIITGICSEIVK